MILMEKYNLIDRFRIKETRDFKNGLFLNRAERTEPWSDSIMEDLKGKLDFTKIGFYYDLDNLYKKYADYLKVNMEQLLITNGADDAIRNIYQIYAKENDNIMFPNPTYGLYNVYTTMFKCNSIKLEYDSNFNINKEKLYENLNKTKIFFLPNPNHCQDIFYQEEIIKICKILEINNGILVVDETYYGFGAPSMIHLLNDFKNLFVIRSFSKTFGLPGIRFGCLLSNNDINISNFRGGYEVSYLTFKIADYFLDNIDIIDNYIKECIEGRDYLINFLKSKNTKYNGDKGYIFNIIFKNNEDAIYIHNRLWQDKIYTRIYENMIGITISPLEYIKKFLFSFNNIMDNLDLNGIINISNIIPKDVCDNIIKYIMNKDKIDFEPFSNSPYRSSISMEEISNINKDVLPKLNTIIKNNLGDDFFIYSITLHYKDKWLGAEEQWHQDYQYNMITHNDKPDNFYRLFIALDDHTKENGCMMFMNKSHTEGLLDYNKILSIHSYQKNRTKSEILDKCYEKYGIEYYPLESGEGVLFNSLILHSSASNQSNLPRRGFQIQIIRKGAIERSNEEITEYKNKRKVFEVEELKKRINFKNT
jgi:histidinol-phosphate aminotransferase